MVDKIIKFDIQLAVAATQAAGVQQMHTPQVLGQHQLTFYPSATPVAGSLAVYGRTIGANDWSLITTIDMTWGQQLFPFAGIFDRFKCVPTGFDAAKKYWVTITTANVGLFTSGVPALVTRSQIATGITATKDVTITRHLMIPQHQLQVDCVGAPAGSVAVFAKALNGALVPLGTVRLISGPRHILFRGYYSGLQFVPTGLGAASLNVTLLSVEDGILGPSLDMLMPMSTGRLLDGQALVYSAAQGRFRPKSFDGFYAHLHAAASQTIATATLTPVKWAVPVYDTLGFSLGAADGYTTITIPYGVSSVILKSNINWTANAVGYVQAFLYKNGAQNSIFAANLNTATVGPNNLIVSPVLSTVVGDTWSVEVEQSSGANLTITDVSFNGTWFSLEVVQ